MRCGARAVGGDCVLPSGHNRGRADLPENHSAGRCRPPHACQAGETCDTHPGPVAPEGVPVERLRALVRLLFPDEMTPTAKRMIESVCEEYAHG